MHPVARALLATALVSSTGAAATPRERGSIGIRAGQVLISGDAEDATGTSIGVSVNFPGVKAWDFLFGTGFWLSVDTNFGNFAYEGTDWPFADDQVSFSTIGISPGIEFFTSLPVQLQLGLPISKIQLDQDADADGDGDDESFSQHYGTTAYVVRVGHLRAESVTFSVEYEWHRLSQTVAGDTSDLNVDFATATVGWVPKD